MGDLISKQAVIEIVENNHVHDITLCGDAYSKGYRNGIRMKQSDILEDLAELPSAEPQIIRCKDCKYYDPIYTHKEGVCEHWNAKTEEDVYCGYAERRT